MEKIQGIIEQSLSEMLCSLDEANVNSENYIITIKISKDLEEYTVTNI